MYSDENMEEIEESIKELEKMKEEAFKFRECIGAGIVWFDTIILNIFFIQKDVHSVKQSKHQRYFIQ